MKSHLSVAFLLAVSVLRHRCAAALLSLSGSGSAKLCCGVAGFPETDRCLFSPRLSGKAEPCCRYPQTLHNPDQLHMGA